MAQQTGPTWNSGLTICVCQRNRNAREASTSGNLPTTNSSRRRRNRHSRTRHSPCRSLCRSLYRRSPYRRSRRKRGQPVRRAGTRRHLLCRIRRTSPS
jgi:hypothetical protein